MSMRLLAVTLLAFVASALCGTAWIVAAPGELRSRAFLVVLLVPIVWAVLMVYAYWDSRSWRPAAALAAGAALSTLIILSVDTLE